MMTRVLCLIFMMAASVQASSPGCDVAGTCPDSTAVDLHGLLQTHVVLGQDDATTAPESKSDSTVINLASEEEEDEDEDKEADEQAGNRRRRSRRRAPVVCDTKNQEDCEASDPGDCSWNGEACATGCESFTVETGCPTSYCVWIQKTAGKKSGPLWEACPGGGSPKDNKGNPTGCPFCSEDFDLVNLGGIRSTNFKAASSFNTLVADGGYRHADRKAVFASTRPQQMTMRRSTDGETYTPCSGTTDCWAGGDERDSDARLKATLGTSTSPSYTNARIEIMVDCGWDGTIEVSHKNVENGDLAVRYNRILQKGWDSNSRRRNSKSIEVDFSTTDEFPELIVDLSKDTNCGSSCTTSVEWLTIYMPKAPVWFDKCLDTKATHGQCQEDFASGDTDLGSSKQLKYNCLTGDSAARDAITGCGAWYTCLTPLGRNLEIVTICTLKPEVCQASDQNFLQQNTQDANTWTADPGNNCNDVTAGDEVCSNPEDINPATFACTCYDQVIDTSSGTPVLRPPKEIRNAACPDAKKHICCSWKEKNCGGNAATGWTVTLLQEDEAKTMSNRSKQASRAEGAALDDSLSGKRTC